MTFGAGKLRQALNDFSEVAGHPERYVVALSGGLDSTVLTHALAVDRAADAPPIVAVYVDHGLQQASAAWGQHCAAFARSLGIEFVVTQVVVDTTSGLGREAAAREARYAALRNLIGPGDWLLSAHHRDDLAETVLLNLLRGSGPAGLAGISPVRRFAAGWLLRPLLDVARSNLERYAEAHSLEWISDPTNQEVQFDRNYLRHEVLPRLEARWDGAANRIRRSAMLAREAAVLLSDLAEIDRRTVGDELDRLDITTLENLSAPRQRNLLRHVIRELGLPMPGAAHLEQVLAELVQARADAQPLVAWPGARARRYRNRLYLTGADDLEPPRAARRRVDAGRVVLDSGLGMLELTPGAARGLADDLVAAGLELRFRQGGEEIQPAGQQHRRKLKKLLQEAGVVPWLRDRVPLLYAGDRLVAVGDLWLAADAVSEPGVAVRWVNRPALF